MENLFQHVRVPEPTADLAATCARSEPFQHELTAMSTTHVVRNLWMDG
jgi:hypothetical protein